METIQETRQMYCMARGRKGNKTRDNKKEGEN